MKTANSSNLSKIGVRVPEGVYRGALSGYEVLFVHDSESYTFKVFNGIRGISSVDVTVKNSDDGIQTFEVETIKE